MIRLYKRDTPVQYWEIQNNTSVDVTHNPRIVTFVDKQDNKVLLLLAPDDTLEIRCGPASVINNK